MGKIKLRFHAKRAGHTEVFSALVDSGADITNLNKATACNLGLDVSTAPEMTMETAGGVKLVGYELRDVHLRQGRREATLPRVFVPKHAEMIGPKGEKIVELAGDNEEQLIGHDFLQATKAKLDFDTHTLKGPKAKAKGVSAAGLRQMIYRPATVAERARLKATPILCKRPVSKKR